MQKVSESKAQEIIQKCKKDVNAWYGWFSENNTSYREDTIFYGGNQWEDTTYAEYFQKQKPTLVVDLVGPNIRKMTGAQKNADITVNIIPKSSKTPQESVDLASGLVSKILYKNDSRGQFSKAFESQLAGGWGVLKITTDYVSSKDFDQDVKLAAVNEPVNVFFDPKSKDSQKNTGDFCGCYQMMSKAEFEATYPGHELPTANMLPDSAPQSAVGTEDTAVVLEYYCREWKTKTLLQLSNGEDYKKICFSDEKDSAEEEYYAMLEERNVPISEMLPLQEINRRKTETSHIKCYKLTSVEVLESYDWPIQRLPYIFVEGQSLWINGKQEMRSFISYARDAQRFYNYAVSEIAYGLKTSRREKFLATASNLKGFANDWRNPEKVQGALLYNPDSKTNSPPIHVPPSEVGRSFFETAALASGDVSKTLGMIDPVNGGLANGASGAAIGRTIAEQNLTVVDYEQNLYSAIELCGKIILELIPKIYDSERTVSVRDPIKGDSRVEINSYDNEGSKVNHIDSIVEDILDIEVNANMSESSQDQLETEFIMHLMQNPEVMPYVVDLIPKSLRLRCAPIIEERLKYLVPEYVQEGKPKPPPPPNPMLDIQKQEIAEKQLAHKVSMNKTMVEANVDMQKMELEKRKINADLIKTEVETSSELETAHLKSNAEVAKSMNDLRSNIVSSVNK